MGVLRKIFKDKKICYNMVVVILSGILLIFMSGDFFKRESNIDKPPEVKPEELETFNTTYESDLEKKLEQTLSLVEGVGKVSVMVTLQNGKELITKNDFSKEKSTTTEQAENGDKRDIFSDKEESTTVKIRGEYPLIVKEISPKISGVLIVAQGGGNIQVKNDLINATKALLDIEIHKIEVLKMK